MSNITETEAPSNSIRIIYSGKFKKHKFKKRKCYKTEMLKAMMRDGM
jgi:hypothetical protein